MQDMPRQTRAVFVHAYLAHLERFSFSGFADERLIGAFFLPLSTPLQPSLSPHSSHGTLHGNAAVASGDTFAWRLKVKLVSGGHTQAEH